MSAMASQITRLTSHDCLLNHLFTAQVNKNIKTPHPWPCLGNSPVTGEFHVQKASNAENVSIWWRRTRRHHAHDGSCCHGVKSCPFSSSVHHMRIPDVYLSCFDPIWIKFCIFITQNKNHRRVWNVALHVVKHGIWGSEVFPRNGGILGLFIYNGNETCSNYYAMI